MIPNISIISEVLPLRFLIPITLGIISICVAIYSSGLADDIFKKYKIVQTDQTKFLVLETRFFGVLWSDNNKMFFVLSHAEDFVKSEIFTLNKDKQKKSKTSRFKPKTISVIKA